MKIPSSILGVLIAGCVLCLTAPRAAAQVSQDDFEALKKMVQQLNEKVQKLEQAHQQDQQTHQQDQQQIQQLKQQLGETKQQLGETKVQLGETQKTATDAQQKAEAASTIQPIHPVPPTGVNATHNFMVVGDAEVQWGKVDGQHSGFVLADFAPIFLFRARDNILFEAGFDVALQNNAPGSSGASTTVDLSFAQLDYRLNDYMTVVAGDMLLPLGTYSERSAGWLNKIPDDPLPRDVLPGSGVGAQLRGAFPLTPSGQSLTYAAYVVNGPSSIDGSATSTNLDLGGNVGLLNSGTTGNLHGTPSGGARVGYFVPFKPRYDLELGISGQTGPWDAADRRLWTAGVFDAALHLGPAVEVKGEFIRSWAETDDLGTIRPRGWWIQGGYKLSGLNLDLPVINNLELVGRYDNSNDGMGTKIDRYTVGYVYYFSNTLLFEGDYEFVSSNNPDSNHNRLVFQLSFGF